MGELSDTDKTVLEIAARTYRYAGAREQAVLAELGWSVTRFWQRLNVLLDEPAALAHDPVTVNRLRRLRETRAVQRTRAA